MCHQAAVSAGKVILTLAGTLKAWCILKLYFLAQTLNKSGIVRCCES